MADANDQSRVVVWYALWATVCGAVAGIVVLLFDTYLFSHLVHRAAIIRNLVDEGSGVLAIAAGQGALALVTASALMQFGRSLQPTVLLGLLIGAFDFGFDLLQVFVPSLEVEWKWKLVIGLLAAVVLTVSGSRRPSGVETQRPGP
jgi:hypothetical protein